MYRRPAQLAGPIFCSRQCHGVSQRAERSCPVCKAAFWGTKKTCSRACSNRSRTGILYDGENGRNKAVRGWYLKEKVALERGGTCEACGHENYRILQIHHITPRARGGGNDVSNLRLLCPNCHMTIHSGYEHFGGSSRLVTAAVLKTVEALARP